RGLFERVGVAADEGDVGPGIRAREGHLAAQSATTAGDEEALAGQTKAVEDAHGSSPGGVYRGGAPGGSGRLHCVAAGGTTIPALLAPDPLTGPPRGLATRA